ncbi:hypothetical protein HOH45_04095 [bacterium]|jgi:hypothetical protein|nr:hypothetical protein [bacterium]
MRKLFAYSHTYKNCRKPLINDTYFNPLAITFSYNKAMALHTKGDIKPFDMSRLNTRYYLKIKQNRKKTPLIVHVIKLHQSYLLFVVVLLFWSFFKPI